MTAIFARAEPTWLPLAASILGVALFLFSMCELVSYLQSMVGRITPDAIIDHLVSKVFKWDVLRDEAIKSRLPSNWESKLERGVWHAPIEVPVTPEQWADLTGHARILLDITSRMIGRSDWQAVKRTVAGIVHGWMGNDKLPPLAVRPRSLPPEEARLHADKQAVIRAAELAYRCGMLAEIWAAAGRQNDEVSGTMVVKAVEELVQHSLLTEPVVPTNISEALIYKRLFCDASRFQWREARAMVVGLISVALEDRYERSERRSLAEDEACVYQSPAPELPTFHLTQAQQVLQRMGNDLLAEDPPENRPDPHCYWMVFRGVVAVTRLAILQRDDALITDIGHHLVSELQAVEVSAFWRRELLRHSQIGDLVRCLGVNLIGGAAAGVYKRKYFWPVPVILNIHWNLTHGLAYRETMGSDSAFLWAIHDIAVQCVQARFWEELEQSIIHLPPLAKEEDDELGLGHALSGPHVAEMLGRILGTAISSGEREAINVCLKPIDIYLHDPRWAKPREAVKVLLGKLQSLASSDRLAGEPDLRGHLESQIRRLEDLGAELDGAAAGVA